MIRATDTAAVRLMIAYRLHFEEANLHAIELVRGRVWTVTRPQIGVLGAERARL
jgi:hypothetical protein